MNRLLHSFLMLVAMALVTAPAWTLADGRGPEAQNPNRCAYSKSLFVNLTTDDYRRSQVALRVMGANVFGEYAQNGELVVGAEGHLFLADDSAVLALAQECWPEPETDAESVLDEQRQCLQQGYIEGQDSDGVGPYGVACDSSVPPVAYLLQLGVRAYGCASCMMDYLEESGCGLSLQDASLEGVELITPDNLTPFLNLYDRTTKRPRCDVDATVISF
jgi:hypothetical protein